MKGIIINMSIGPAYKTNSDKVKEFHDTYFKEKDPSTPKKLNSNDIALLILRKNLIKEEYNELSLEFDKLINRISKGEILQEIDLAPLLKELADLAYVTYGGSHALGVDLDTIFNSVHNSNMSKLGNDGLPIYREDGKVLKGPNYTPPNIENLILDIIKYE